MRIFMSEEHQLEAYNKVVTKLREIFHSDVCLHFKKATLEDKLGFVGNIIEWKTQNKSGWLKIKDFLSETDIPHIFHMDTTDLHEFKKTLRKTAGNQIDIYELATVIMKSKTKVVNHKFNDF